MATVSRIFFLGLILSLPQVSEAQTQIVKANNTTTLDSAGSWVGGVAPGSADIAVYSSSILAANSTSVGAGVSFGGIQFSDNPGGNIAISAGTGTLALGLSGIDIRNSTNRTLTIAAPIALNADQTWITGNFGTVPSSSSQITTSNTISGSSKLTIDGTADTAAVMQNSSVYLNALNTYSGGTVLNARGVLRVATNVPTFFAGAPTASSIGVGSLSIYGGMIFGASSGSIGPQLITVTNDFAVNYGTSPLNGRFTIAGGTMDLAGGTRTVSLGRFSTSTTAMTGGYESFRFTVSANAPATVITNGTLRFVRGNTGAASDYVSVTFGANTGTAAGSGFVFGSNVITTLGTGTPFGTTQATLPYVTVEAGGYFNLSDAANARSPSIRTLSGDGVVTSLANMAAANTATLTINPQSGDTATFSGQIINGSSIAGTLGGGFGTNVIVALTKSGTGTQILSGSNNMSGAISVGAGELRFMKRNSLYAGNSNLWTGLSVASGATLGLSLGGTNGFISSDLDVLAANTNIMKAGSKLGLDVASSNGPLTLSTILSNSVNANGITFNKTGNGQLNLSGYTGIYTNPVTISGGTLKFTQLSTYSGTPAITGGGVLDLGGASFLIPNSVTLTSGSMVNFTAGVSDPFAPTTDPSYTGFSFSVNNFNGNGRTIRLTNSTLTVTGNVTTNAFNISGVAGALRLNGVTTNTSGYSLSRIAFQNLTTGDLGYAATDTIEIDPPDLPGGVQATATLGSLVNVSTNTFNTFTSATLNNAGSGYSKPPAVRIITSTGSNLVTYAELKEVGTINIQNGGVMEFATNSSFSSLRPINPGDTNGGTVWVNGGKVFTKWSVIGSGTNKSGLLKVSGGSLVIDPYSANALYFSQYTGSGSLLLEGGEIQSPSIKVSGGGAANIRITGGTYLATTPTAVSGTVFSGSQGATNVSFSMEGGSLLATNSSFNFGYGVSNGNSVFTQTNGTIKTLEMNAQSGTFVMSGGTNECNGMVVGSVSGSPATFTQSGGLILINGGSGSVVAANDFVIGNGSGSGTYTLNAGVLQVFGKIRKDVGTGALVLNGGTVRYTNSINQTNFISDVDTTVGTNGAIFEITDPNVTNSIQTNLKQVSIDQPGKLEKRGLGSLSIGRALLNYTGSTLIEAGKLVVTGTNFTAEIANNAVNMSFNPAPAANIPATNTYSVLPGALANGTTAILATQLNTNNQTITFNPSLGTAKVVTTVLATPPVINSTSSFSGTVGVDFSSQITASGDSPITYSGTDLPGGLSVSTNGLITGRPTTAGTFTNSVLTAINAAGTNNQSVTFVIAPGGPTFASSYTNNLTDVAPNGLTYLANYAFGGSSSSAAALPYQDKSDSLKLTLIAYVRTNDNTVSVKGEKGSSLNNWDTNLINGVPAGDNIGAPAGTQKQIFSVTNSGDRLFLRLKVTK